MKREKPQATRLPPPPTFGELFWSAIALIALALFAAGIRSGVISWL